MLHHTAIHCNAPCNSLQHAATHSNTVCCTVTQRAAVLHRILWSDLLLHRYQVIKGDSICRNTLVTHCTTVYCHASQNNAVWSYVPLVPNWSTDNAKHCNTLQQHLIHPATRYSTLCCTASSKHTTYGLTSYPDWRSYIYVYIYTGNFKYTYVYIYW